MIRAATHDDIPRMLELGRAMHTESRFAHRPWNEAKVAALMPILIDSDDGLILVAEQNGEIVGGFLGSVSDHWCTDSREACDLALYVDPAMRGGLTGARLIGRYKQWARERGADSVLLGITTGVDLASSTHLYDRLGFAHVGNLFELERA